MLGIIGKKIGMTQVFNEDGIVTPVTVIEAEPMVVTQIKTVDTDGYNAVQVATGSDVKAKNVNKPKTGHFEKAGVEVRRTLMEFRIDNPADYSVGQMITVELLEAGILVDATGNSKGKGTAGAIKRWNQKLGPATHGSKFHRAAGSLGAASYPARVIKGMHMAGRMGNETCTVQNLELVRVDAERNLLLVKGAVPGPRKGTVIIKTAVKTAK